jgi:hypothetical protein
MRKLTLLIAILSMAYTAHAETRVSDPMTDISRGAYSDRSVARSHGDRTDVSTTNRSLWVYDVNYDWDKANGATVAGRIYIVSTSTNDTSVDGDGARTVLVKGVDANWAYLSETIALTGQTAIVSTGSYLRVNSADVVTAGSTLLNVGTIAISETNSVTVPATGIPNTTNGLYGIITVGENQMDAFRYSVPAAKSASLQQLTISEAAAAAGWGEATISTRLNGGPWITRTVIGFSSGETLNYEPRIPLHLPAKTDLDIKAKASAVGKTYHGDLSLSVVDD